MIRTIQCCAFAVFTLSQSAFAQRTFTVTPLKYFGNDGGEPARGKLPADAAMLGSAARVCELALGSVAVYDASMKRIVIFDSAGNVQHHIGRAGKGPGEFSNVLAMDCDRDRIGVFDYNLSRVTIFDTSGVIVKTVPTSLAVNILLRGDSIWGGLRGGTKNALWSQQVNDLPAKRRELLPVQNPNVGFDAPGEGVYYVMGRDNDGTALIAHNIPGLWYTANTSGVVSAMQGKELLPGEKAWTTRDGITVSPGQIDAIFGLGKDWIGMVFLKSLKDVAPKQPNYVRKLAVFERSGAFIGFAKMNEPITRVAAASSRPREFYYVSSEPYFRVVRAVVAEVKK